MSKKTQLKSLRIGVFHNNSLIEQDIHIGSDPVWIGSETMRARSKKYFALPSPSLPPRQELFVFKDERWHLHFTEKMTGKISTGEETRSLQQLISSGLAKKSGGGYYLPLTERTYGRVAFGKDADEVAVLFQFVRTPPPRQHPVLPASMRGGVISGVTGASFLALTIAASFLFQVGFVAFLLSQDWPQPLDREYELPDRFVRVIIEQDLPEPDPVELEVTGEGPGEEVAEDPGPPEPSPEPKEEPREKTAEERAAEDAERRRRLAEEVQNKTILGQIGALSQDGGSLVDTLSQGAGRTSMDDAFANAQGVQAGVAGAEKSGLRTGGSADADGRGAAVGIGDLKGTAGAKKAAKGVDTGKAREQQVKAKMDLRAPEQMVGTGTLDAASISDVLRRRQSAIQTCYERVLRNDPTARGRVVVNFTIGGAGRVTAARATQDQVGGGVGDCIANTIQRMRFPSPQGGDVTTNVPFIFEPQN